MIIAMLGSPGVGKGTIAKLLAKEHGFTHVSTGDLLRSEIKNQTAIGKQIESTVDAGILIPSDMVMKIVRNKLKELKGKKVILDGAPRTILEAEEGGYPIDKVINLHAPEDLIIKRLTGRRLYSKCGKIYNVDIGTLIPKVAGKCDIDGANLIHRDDDQPDVIKDRLDIYYRQTKPVEEHYRKEGLIIDIDASDNPAAILKRVEKALKLFF